MTTDIERQERKKQRDRRLRRAKLWDLGESALNATLILVTVAVFGLVGFAAWQVSQAFWFVLMP